MKRAVLYALAAAFLTEIVQLFFGRNGCLRDVLIAVSALPHSVLYKGKEAKMLHVYEAIRSAPATTSASHFLVSLILL